MSEHDDDRKQNDLTQDEPKSHARKHDERKPNDGLSRREIITAGVVAVGAVGASLSPLPVIAGEEHALASGGAGTTAAEFRARFEQTGQTGEHFVGYGYLTAVRSLSDDDLFGGQSPSEATALFTAYAEGELVRRTLDQSVHSLDIVGTLTIYQRASPGASFQDAASFQVGTAVAVYDLTLQDIVTVFAPSKGLPTLTGDMRQKSAARLEGTSHHRPFGNPGARARLFATGLGTLTDPQTSNSLLEMAGNWTMK